MCHPLTCLRSGRGFLLRLSYIPLRRASFYKVSKMALLLSYRGFTDHRVLKFDAYHISPSIRGARSCGFHSHQLAELTRNKGFKVIQQTLTGATELGSVFKVVHCVDRRYDDVSILIQNLERDDDISGLAGILPEVTRLTPWLITAVLKSLTACTKRNLTSTSVDQIVHILSLQPHYILRTDALTSDVITRRFDQLHTKVLFCCPRLYLQALFQLNKLKPTECYSIGSNALKLIFKNQRMIHNDTTLQIMKQIWAWKNDASVVTPTDFSFVMGTLLGQCQPESAERFYELHKSLAPLESAAMMAEISAMQKDANKSVRIFNETVQNLKNCNIKREDLNIFGDMAVRLWTEEPEILEKTIGILLESPPGDQPAIFYLALMSMSAKLGRSEEVKTSYKLALEHGVAPEPIYRSLLIEAYSVCGNVIAIKEHIDQILRDKEQLLANDIAMALDACKVASDTKAAQWFWKQLVETNGPPQFSVYDAFLSSIIKIEGSKARKICFEMTKYGNLPIKTLEILFADACQHGEGDIVRNLERYRVDHSIPPTEGWYESILKYYAISKKWDKLVTLFRELKEDDIYFSPRFYSPVLRMLDMQKNSSAINKLLKDFSERRYTPTPKIYSYYFMNIFDRNTAHITELHRLALKTLDSTMIFKICRSKPPYMFSSIIFNRLVRKQIKLGLFADCRVLLDRLNQICSGINLRFLASELDYAVGDYEAAIKNWEELVMKYSDRGIFGQRILKRNMRFTAYHLIQSIMKSYAKTDRYEDLLNLPDVLPRVNLGMTSQGWNYYIKSTLTAANLNKLPGDTYFKVFDICESWQISRYFKENPYQYSMVSLSSADKGSSSQQSINPDENPEMRHFTGEAEVTDNIRAVWKPPKARYYRDHQDGRLGRTAFTVVAESITPAMEVICTQLHMPDWLALRTLRLRYPKTFPAALWLRRKRVKNQEEDDSDD